jgi:hypothetical protein
MRFDGQADNSCGDISKVSEVRVGRHNDVQRDNLESDDDEQEEKVFDEKVEQRGQ